MKRDDMDRRTKAFALRIIKMYGVLPSRVETSVIGKQVLRSGTSVAANYREAGRSRSRIEMAAKLGVVEQELAETQLWLELLIESGFASKAKMQPLMDECEQLLKIIVATIKRLKSRLRKPAAE